MQHLPALVTWSLVIWWLWVQMGWNGDEVLANPPSITTKHPFSYPFPHRSYYMINSDPFVLGSLGLAWQQLLKAVVVAMWPWPWVSDGVAETPAPP